LGEEPCKLTPKHQLRKGDAVTDEALPSEERSRAPGAHDDRRPSMTDRRLFKMGSMAGIWGAIVAFPFVVTHPHLPPGSAVGVLETVRDFGPWLFLHMGLMFVLIVILLGLAAISRSVEEEKASSWAVCAFWVGVIGTVFGILGQGVDGLGFEVAKDIWVSANTTDQGTAVLVAGGVAGVATGIFILVLFFYFGLTSLVYGLTFAMSKEYPAWLAAFTLLGGTLGLSAALATYYDDFSDPVYYGMFIPSAVIFLLWVLAASIMLYRKHVWVAKPKPAKTTPAPVAVKDTEPAAAATEA
jgi:hypothetical protein